VHKVLFLALSVTFLFVYEIAHLRIFILRYTNVRIIIIIIILGTADRFYAKFTWKMCLVPHSDEFECQVS